MKPRSVYFTLVLAFLFAGACSVLKKENPEQKIREYLSSFETDLSKSDEEILGHFKTARSQEALMAIIKVLQNKEEVMECRSNFPGASITPGERIKVEIPVTLTLRNVESVDSAATSLVLWLKADEERYRIVDIEGEAFYNDYARLKNDHIWEVERQLAYTSRSWVYERVANLEPVFDSIIWYTTYKDATLFYFVEGSWENYFISSDQEPATTGKMGLLDQNGEIILPAEYDLIGTVAFDLEDMVEITKDGKVGYFDLKSKKVVVEPAYDMIIPNRADDVLAIVKTDTAYGWIDQGYTFHTGFPSDDIRSSVEDFEYLRKFIKIVAGEKHFAEIPLMEHAGSGIIIPPSYLVRNGILPRISGGITTTKVPLNAWTEYKEINGTLFERVASGLNALVTTMKERYLEGREEFYTSSSIVFVDNNNDVIGTERISGEDIEINVIDSTLVLVTSPHDWWFVEECGCAESNLINYTFFRIADGKVSKLESNRAFNQTEFIKLDSTHISGEFIIYNNVLERNETTPILSVATLTFMRDEILATYGYRFPDDYPGNYWKERKWYDPHHDTVESIIPEMTEIDRANLEFLNKVISMHQPAA